MIYVRRIKLWRDLLCPKCGETSLFIPVLRGNVYFKRGNAVNNFFKQYVSVTEKFQKIHKLPEINQ